MHPVRFSQNVPFIAVYSLAHLIVDASCVFFIYGFLEPNKNIILGMLMYNASAFVLQAPFGFMIDRVLNPRVAAIGGLLLIAFSYLFWNAIYPALIIIGIGNALFHVGGGSLVLSIKERKATFVGLFVAPGGIGLVIGSWLYNSQFDINQMFFPAILIFLGLALFFIDTPDFNRSFDRKKATNFGILLIALIMIPIAVRSLIGLSLGFPWKENRYLFLVLIAALALGKISGGILADKYGILKVGVGGLIIATPLLAFFQAVPYLGILGAFVFNFTMPVTLIAILNLMPDNRGLSFGLTTIAIFIGSIPRIIGKDAWLKNDMFVFLTILIAAGVLFAALHFNNKANTINS
jgi:MFS transporter, FSR family, fosmidomycin resistance protein